MLDQVVRPVRADLLESKMDINHQSIRALLKCVPLLSEVSEEDLNALTAHCTWHDVQPGTRFIEQGEIGDSLYVVLKGRLTVHQEQGDTTVLLGELRRNQAFGELALLEESKRTATVIAQEECRLLGLGRKAFQEYLSRNRNFHEHLLQLAQRRRSWAERQHYRPNSESMMEMLAKWTNVTDPQTLADIENEVDWITTPAGSVLIRAGEPGEHMFFLVDGELEVSLRRLDGSRTIVARLKEQTMVGEIALLTNQPRTADVVAIADSELLRLSRQGYEMLVARHPASMAVFSTNLASRLVEQLQSRSAALQVCSMPLPTEDECREIVETPDLILRNLKITQMYHRLSVQLAALLGQHDANWCTFATHASKTAGNSIRKEELPGYELLFLLEERFEAGAALRNRLDRLMERGAQRSGLLAHFEGITRHISNCISGGNLKVFAELAPLFAAFLRCFQDGVNSDPHMLSELCASLEPGESSAGGQQLLAEAFQHYFDAMFETDAKRKAELLLLGNCKIGLHEQIRLQPYIVEALNTPLEDLLDPHRKYDISILTMNGTAAPCGSRTRFLRWLMKRWRIVLTRYMMRLRLPYGDVSLGRDLPRLPNRRAYPDVLQDIESPQLKELLQRFARTGHGLRHSRSQDWGDLNDRMNFIVSLFRSRHKSLELFDQPFCYEQRRAMEAGTVPGGRL